MPVLTSDQRAFLAAARTATLATIDAQGRPRLVPICFALQPDAGGDAPVLYTPLDEKPKHVADVRGLARVRDILATPEVALLVDHWDEDWLQLAWLRVAGTAELLEPEDDVAAHTEAVGLLRAKYPQYAMHALETLPIIRVRLERALGWEATRRT